MKYILINSRNGVVKTKILLKDANIVGEIVGYVPYDYETNNILFKASRLLFSETEIAEDATDYERVIGEAFKNTLHISNDNFLSININGSKKDTKVAYEKSSSAVSELEFVNDDDALLYTMLA